MIPHRAAWKASALTARWHRSQTGPEDHKTNAKQNRLGSKKKTRKEAALSNRKGRKRAEGEGRDKNQVRSLNGRDVNSCTCLLTTLTEQGDFHTAILMGFLILEDPARPSGLSKVQFVHLYPSHFIHPPLLQLLRRLSSWFEQNSTLTAIGHTYTKVLGSFREKHPTLKWLRNIPFLHGVLKQ